MLSSDSILIVTICKLVHYLDNSKAPIYEG